MSEKEKTKWEEFKKTLEKKGYFEPEKSNIFFKFSIKALSLIGSLFRLSFLFSLFSSFIMSGLITIIISFLQKKILILVFFYYFPLLFFLFFWIIPLFNLILQIKPVKNPSLFSFYSSLILSIFCALSIFGSFGFFLSEKLRISLIFLEISLLFLIFYPPFKVLSFLSWKEIPTLKIRRVYYLTFIVLLGISLLVFFIYSKEEKIENLKIPISPVYKPLAVLAVDGLPFSKEIFKGAEIEKFFQNSLIFNLKLDKFKSPPVFWTEISTGFPPEINGFLNLKTYKLPFIKEDIYPLPLSFFFEKLKISKESISTMGGRKKRTFWEVSSLYGRYTLSLNWWASWQPLEQSVELISNLYFIKELKGEKGIEYNLLNPKEFEKNETPTGFKWNKFVFDSLKYHFKKQALITLYYPGLDVQMEEIKRGGLKEALENFEYLKENLDILKSTLNFFEENKYKIILISYSGRSEDNWAWGFIYPKERNIKIEEVVSKYSIFPTILKILNLPISLKFKEKPLPLPFETPESIYIRDYPSIKEKKPIITSPPLEELKSLGYLQ